MTQCCSPLRVVMNPGVLGEMLSLGKGLVTELADEGLVERPGARLTAARGAHLVLDDGGGLAEGVPLGLALRAARGRWGHAGDLDWDPG